MGKLEGWRPSERLRHRLVDDIKRDLTIYSVRLWARFISHRTGLMIMIMMDYCEHSNGPSSSVRCWNFLEWLLKKESS
jgi:hypothetical protein